MNAGYKFSVEKYYLFKLLIMLLSLVFLISIQTTNIYKSLNGTIENVNYGKNNGR